MKRRNFIKDLLLAIAAAPVVVDSIFKAVEASEQISYFNLATNERHYITMHPMTPDESIQRLRELAEPKVKI